MKLFDKVKNMFTEEVEEEVQVEQVKPAKKRKKASEIDALEQIKEEKKKEEEKKPIFFTDEDFDDLDLFRKHDEQKKEKKRELSEEEKPRFIEEKDEQPPTLPHRNTAPYEEVKQVNKFKPTPIISPVYGILDKNYHKEDIVSKTESEYQAVDGLSVDSIRNKAYGTLEDELENTLFGNNSILFNDEDNKKDEVFDEVEKETDNDILDELSGVDDKHDKSEELEKIDHDLEDLENITMDIGKELDSLLSKKNDESDENEDDLFDLIDNMYEGDDEDDN